MTKYYLTNKIIKLNIMNYPKSNTINLLPKFNNQLIQLNMTIYCTGILFSLSI